MRITESYFSSWILRCICDVSVIYDYCGGSVRDVMVANGIVNSAVFDTILVNLRLVRIVCTYVNHITMFYLRDDSSQISFSVSV